jgi:hypothetical protein
MVVIQSLNKTCTGLRTQATTNSGDKEIGLKSGDAVDIYEKNGTLLFTQNYEPKTGFNLIAVRKVFTVNGKSQIIIQKDWCCKGLTHVKVYYTKIGLFVTPFNDEL